MNLKLVNTNQPEQPRAAVTPEEHFLNPFAAIDPLELSKNVLARTVGIISTLKKSAFCDADIRPDQLGYALDQVEANLNMLEWTLENMEEETADN